MRYWKLTQTPWLLNLILFAAASNASSADPKLCGKACRQTFRILKFADAPEGAFFARQECTSRLYQISLHFCWDVYCCEDVWVAESRAMNQTCQNMYDSYLAQHDIINGITDDKKAQIAKFNATDPGRTHRYNELMLPTSTYFNIWVRTLVSTLYLTQELYHWEIKAAHDYVWEYHYYYGCAMGIFWVIVIAVGMANQVLTRLNSMQGRRGVWLRRNILTPATFGQRCVQDFGGWGTLPPRIQTLTLSLFVILNMLCSIHGYEIFEGYG